MPIVFVHGVNVRDDGGYNSAVRARDELFRRISFRDHSRVDLAEIVSPYWGGHGATFPFGHAYLPQGQEEVFGSGDTDVDEGALDHPVDGAKADEALVSVAKRHGLSSAVDALWSYVGRVMPGAQLVELAETGRLASEYATSNESPAWLRGTTNDGQLIDQLIHSVHQLREANVEAFGALAKVGALLRQGAAGVGQRLVNAAMDPVAPRAKRIVVLRFARFFGDVMCYIKEGSGGPIRKTVCDAIRSANAARAGTGGKLIVVGHSMGGNIAYDLLSNVASDVDIDLFLTVGSQVGLFEELKLFSSSQPTSPRAATPQVVRPRNIARWINVFDPSDPFGYATKGVFEGSEDFAFDNRVGPLSAHSAYFFEPGFHARLFRRRTGGCA